MNISIGLGRNRPHDLFSNQDARDAPFCLDLQGAWIIFAEHSARQHRLVQAYIAAASLKLCHVVAGREPEEATVGTGGVPSYRQPGNSPRPLDKDGMSASLLVSSRGTEALDFDQLLSFTLSRFPWPLFIVTDLRRNADGHI